MYEKQARRFPARAGGLEVRDRDAKLERFMRKIALERFTRPANYVHWSFDETTGNLAAASVPGFEAKLETTVRICRPRQSRRMPPKAVSNRIHCALQLDGQSFAKAAFPGIRQRAARTVAFWVNVPVDAPLPEAGAILAWPLGTAGRNVQIGWNRNPTQGVLGALRTDAGRGSIVGSATLRDGHWHHLAVVFSPKAKGDKAEKADKGDGALQLRQYVDGRLETASFKHFFKRAKGVEATQVASAEDALWIGREVEDTTGARFRGLLDELYVADAALTPVKSATSCARTNRPRRRFWPRSREWKSGCGSR